MDRLPAALEEMCRSYEAYLEGATRLSPRSKAVYRLLVRRFFIEVGAQQLADVTPETLLSWQQGLRKAGQRASTLNQRHSALKSFLKYREEFLEDTHAALLLKMLRRMEIPKDAAPIREPYTLSEDILERLLAACEGDAGTAIRNRAIVHFFWATGVRRAELINARVQDVDLTQRMAVVTGKGNKTRLVVFDEACAEDLRRWFEVRERAAPDCDQLFITVQNKPLASQTLFEVLKDTCRRAGLRQNVWTHLFRHSAITRLLDGGMNIQDVATFAGHSSVNTTMMYFHKGAESLKAAYDRATTEAK